MTQFDLFQGVKAPNRPTSPNVDEIRRRLETVLDALRTAQRLPWADDELEFHRKVVPQMANWLPQAEADSVRAEFCAELARLQASVS